MKKRLSWTLVLTLFITQLGFTDLVVVHAQEASASVITSNQGVMTRKTVQQQTIEAEYVLIANTNEDSDVTQSSGTIMFDQYAKPRYAYEKKLPQKKHLAEIKSLYGDKGIRIRKKRLGLSSYEINENKWIDNTKFTCVGIGKHCYVWMDEETLDLYSSQSLEEAVTNMIDVYDNQVYANFGFLESVKNIDFADNSGKMSILLQDLQEGVAGYFWEYEEFPEAGEITAIHIDCEGGMTDFTHSCITLAHETQHAINCHKNRVDTWLDEGLSCMISDFFNCGSGEYGWLDGLDQNYYLKNGASLIYSNYSDDVGMDYGLPFLFLRYLNAQANASYKYDSDFYNKFYSISREWYESDVDLLEKVIQSTDTMKDWTFEDALINFKIAMFVQDKTGVFGFYNDPVVRKSIGQSNIYNGMSGKSINIPGSGSIIVKTIDGEFQIPEIHGKDIRYVGFNLDDFKRAGTFIGEGTSESPFLINDPKDLFIINEDGYSEKCFRLERDLYLDKYDNECTADSYVESAPFKGELDGNNKAIVNLSRTMIWQLEGCVKNLTLFANNLDEKHYNINNFGGMAVEAKLGAIIENCHIKGNINTTKSDTVGGLIGLTDNCIIKNCSAEIELSYENAEDDSYVGGLIGFDFGSSFTDCYSSGSMEVNFIGNDPESRYVGGLIGIESESEIENVYSAVELVSQNENAIGSLIGYANGGSIKNAYCINSREALGTNNYCDADFYAASEEELRRKDTYQDFDFVNIWEIGEGEYPKLQSGLNEFVPELSPSPEVSASPSASFSPDASISPDVSSSPDTSTSPGTSSSPGTSTSPGTSSSPDTTPVPTIGGIITPPPVNVDNPKIETRVKSSTKIIKGKCNTEGAIVLLLYGKNKMDTCKVTNGKFKFIITPQKPGTIMRVIAIKDDMEDSEIKSLKVGLAAPKCKSIKPRKIIGTAYKSSKVKAYYKSKLYGSAKVSSKGKFTVKLKKKVPKGKKITLKLTFKKYRASCKVKVK